MYIMGNRRVQHATMSNATLLAGPLRTNVCSLASSLTGGCLPSSSDELDSDIKKSSSSISESSSESSLSEVFALNSPGEISSIPTVFLSSAEELDFDSFESAGLEASSLG